MSSDESPDAAESPQFTAVAPHYDVLMREVPYREWVAYLEELLERRGFAHGGTTSPLRVLDLACGTGNVAQILAGRGCEVVGVDLSEGMVEAARRKAARRDLPIRYYVQDAAELELPGPPFDLCVCLFDSLNYILEPARIARAMERVHAHLRPGGLFIFDINSAYALEHGFFAQDNLHSSDRLRYVWRSDYDPATRLCHVAMRFFLRERTGVDREFRETHVQFAYREDELRDMLSLTGFTALETFHAYTFQPVRPTTDRIFFVAQRE